MQLFFESSACCCRRRAFGARSLAQRDGRAPLPPRVRVPPDASACVLSVERVASNICQ